MRKAYSWLALAAIAVPAVGCSMGSKKSISPAQAPLHSTSTRAPNFGKPPAEDLSVTDHFKSALTQNPVSQSVGSTFKKGAAWLSPKPRVKPAKDPTSLATKTRQPKAGLYVAMGDLQFDRGNLANAQKQYEKALEAEPKNLKALLAMAHFYDRQEQLDEAIGYYQQAVKLHPQSAAAANDLGLCLARQEKFDDAAAMLVQATRLAPTNPRYRNNVATVLVELDRVDEALIHLTKAHGKAVAQYNVGYLLHQRGRNTQAAGHFSAALAADPSLVQAKQMLASLNASPATIAHRHAGAGQQPTPAATEQPAVRLSQRPAPQPPANPSPNVTPLSAHEPPAQTSPVQPTPAASPVANRVTNPVTSNVQPEAAANLPQQVNLQLPQGISRPAAECRAAPQPGPAPAFLQQSSSTDTHGEQYERSFNQAAKASRVAELERALQYPASIGGHSSVTQPAMPSLPERIRDYQATSAPLPLPVVNAAAPLNSPY